MMAAIAATLTLRAVSSADAQSVGRMLESDARNMVKDVGSVWASPEPLLAPPAGTEWLIRWSSEDPAYGGMGTAPLDTSDNWRIPGHATVVLSPHKP